jgi:hypothetical protein
VERPVERRDGAPVDDGTLDDAPTDPRLPIVDLTEEIDDAPRDDLPPGFADTPRWANGYGPHPATQSAFTTLTFRARPDPWYRTNAAKLALVVLGLVAAVAGIVVLLWPSSSSAPQDSGITTAPAPTPSATPSPTPSASLAPPAPPPVLLPPPPPPPPPSESAPAAPPAYYPPRYYQPDTPTKKPQIDVTRAPISVAPSVSAPSQRDSSTPGDSPGPRRRGCFGFC